MEARIFVRSCNENKDDLHNTLKPLPEFNVTNITLLKLIIDCIMPRYACIYLPINYVYNIDFIKFY